MLGRRLRAAPPRSDQTEGVSVASTSTVNARSVPQSTPMTGAAPLGAHHVHRQVVHRAAVDEDFAALEHGRQHARDRDRSPQPAPQRSLLVNGDAAGRQVRRHAEEGQGQVLDVDVAEFAAQQHADLAAGDQRDERQREVGQRVGVDEAALEAKDELLVAPVRGDARSEDGAHAAAADDVDRHAVLAQRAHDAEVREARARRRRRARGRPPARQHAHQAVVVGGRAQVMMRHARERARQRAAAPFANPPSCSSSSSARRMPPSGHSGSGPGGALARAARREQHDVGLAQAQPRPRGVAGIGRVDDEIVLRLALVEPLRAVAACALRARRDRRGRSGRAHRPAGLRAAEGRCRIERNERERARRHDPLLFASRSTMRDTAGGRAAGSRPDGRAARARRCPPKASQAPSRAAPARSPCAAATR